MIVDSNIIIYSARVEYQSLRDFIAEHAPAVSAISYVEVLGYHNITPNDKLLFEKFFEDSLILPLDESIFKEAVRLRQMR